MDGGRRFLRSLKEQLYGLLWPALLRPAGVIGAQLPLNPFQPRPAPRFRPAQPFQAEDAPAAPARREGPGALDRLTALALLPGVGTLGLAILFGGVGWTAFVDNGSYAALVAQGGEPADMVARAIGFPIDAVTISGQQRLREQEILAAAHIDPRKSLLLLDAAEVRQRLMQLPLVKSARVLKLYPDHLVIALEEREPNALWQREGKVAVIAADGTVIDEFNDDRFLGLPFVVGEGAEKRLPEYKALREGLGDLASRIKAGVLVSGRRWTLVTTNGVEIKLPERDPGAAVGTLARLQREARILDKDILTIDLRLPGRVAVRLTEEGAAARGAAVTRKPVKSGAHT
jgi:cell division protein FtsQ